MMRTLNAKAIRDELQAQLPLDTINALPEGSREVALKAFDDFGALIAELAIYEAGGEEEMAKQVVADMKVVADTLLDLISVASFEQSTGVWGVVLADVGELFQGAASAAIKMAASKAAEVAVEAISRKLGA